MKSYDLTLTLDNDLAPFPNDPSFINKKFSTIEDDGVNVTKIEMSSHIGTHVDAPSHYILGGKSITDFPADYFCGFAITLYTRPNENNELNISCIQKGQINESDIVILTTDWYKKIGTDEYFKNSPSISKELAEYFVSKKVKAVCVDTPTVDMDGSIHKILLSNDILIYESLTNTDSIIDTRGFFIGVPLKLKDCDASPVRAVFIKNTDMFA